MKLGAQSVAVVTGAASGIGRAVALELAKRGVAVAMIDTDRAGLAEAYAASKHAAHAFTVALGAELAGSGVTVTAVYPGATATALVARGEAVDSEKQAREAAMLARGLAPEEVARRLVRAVERGRRRVLIGRDTRLLDFATRAAPALVQAAVRRYWRRVPFL